MKVEDTAMGWSIFFFETAENALTIPTVIITVECGPDRTERSGESNHIPQEVTEETRDRMQQNPTPRSSGGRKITVPVIHQELKRTLGTRIVTQTAMLDR